MSRIVDGQQAAARHHFHQRRAELEGYAGILLTPDDEDRSWMLADARKLRTLVDLRVAHHFGQSRAAKSLVLHLDAVTRGPVGKAFGVTEVPELLIRPPALLEDRGVGAPRPRHA